MIHTVNLSNLDILLLDSSPISLFAFAIPSCKTNSTNSSTLIKFSILENVDDNYKRVLPRIMAGCALINEIVASVEKIEFIIDEDQVKIWVKRDHDDFCLYIESGNNAAVDFVRERLNGIRWVRLEI